MSDSAAVRLPPMLQVGSLSKYSKENTGNASSNSFFVEGSTDMSSGPSITVSILGEVGLSRLNCVYTGKSSDIGAQGFSLRFLTGFNFNNVSLEYFNLLSSVILMSNF